MHIGTNQRIGGLVMRYGLRSQRAPLDCTSSRRSTVMRALPRVTGVTTGYQRDSSSKRPVSSVTLAARATHRPGEATAAMDAEERAHRLENERNVLHSYHRHLTDGHSISASVLNQNRRALPSARRAPRTIRRRMTGSGHDEPSHECGSATNARRHEKASGISFVR